VVLAFIASSKFKQKSKNKENCGIWLGEFECKMNLMKKKKCSVCIITLEPCALNAEFQHFMMRFSKISLLLQIQTERGI